MEEQDKTVDDSSTKEPVAGAEPVPEQPDQPGEPTQAQPDSAPAGPSPLKAFAASILSLSGKTMRERISSVLIVVLVIFGFAQLLRVKAVQSTSEQQIRAEQASSREALRVRDEQSTSALALSFSAGAQQMFVLQTQYPDISDRTFQAMCRKMAETGLYKRVVVTDSGKKIIASTDLTETGQMLTLTEGNPATESIAAVKSGEATLGYVFVQRKD